MRYFSIRLTTIRRVFFVLLVGAGIGLLSGCDSNSPEPSLEPEFDMTIGDPVNTSLKGAAAFGGDLSLDGQGVFTLPIGPLGKTASIIQLSGESDQGVTHDLAFMRLADGPIEEKTYEIGRGCEEDCGPVFFPDELFLADYGRETADSLHSYPIDSGTVTVETVTDEGVRGTFDLSSSLEISVSAAEMEAFVDSLRDRSFRDTTRIPTPPPMDLQFLDQPMTIDGSFTATSTETLSEGVPHLGGFGVGTTRDTIVIGE